MELREKLYRLRKKRGITQADVAERLNVSRQSVSNWESGSTTPSVQRLEDLSLLYEVPLESLLDESEMEGPEQSPAEEESTSNEGDEITDSVPERPRARLRWVRFAGIVVLAIVLLTLVILLVVHRNSTEEGVSVEVPLDEMSNGNLSSESLDEFNFN